ncbi:MAG TPA: hypothetical protein PLF50_07190 [Candidatus Cloacimonadota bacterium]|nr:hypothetical protein [Candidatus Cloacimonadota bacterium]HOV17257.1 hypothetical protein [Candidatus Cloacimonadota bacterium]HQL15051.1 hypothetical protein [Candidatus Cloacimonadota bacterium]
MNNNNNSKVNISDLLYNLLTILFLCYVFYMLKNIGSYLRAIAVVGLMIPLFISIVKNLRGTGRANDLERWIFALLALALWVIQSAIAGKLHRIFFS